MPKFYYSPIWADPMWDCGPREILPEDDHALWIHCDHCFEIARFERCAALACDGFWCAAHAPFRHPDDPKEPFEVSPRRWSSPRIKRLYECPPWPAPAAKRRAWDVTDAAEIQAALAALHRHNASPCLVQDWILEDWDLEGPDGVEIPNLVFMWPHRTSER